ncbi:MAG TPA: hypothetical protein VMB27_26925 [Solirubrobacteraceae bacterium]|nr:hypothetical protein [Solirubrobacteraceae bacterium]
MLGIAYHNPLFPRAGEARALEAWRDAERLVASRWQCFLAAEPESRVWAFASYVAALDAEEAAAADLATTSLRFAA